MPIPQGFYGILPGFRDSGGRRAEKFALFSRIAGKSLTSRFFSRFSTHCREFQKVSGAGCRQERAPVQQAVDRGPMTGHAAILGAPAEIPYYGRYIA
jgi:hypothetical protein